MTSETYENTHKWVTIKQEAFQLTLERCLAKKQIQPRDVAVLMMIICNLKVSTGRCHENAEEIAQMLSKGKTEIWGCLSRLCKAAILARTTARVGLSYIVDPHIVTIGGSKIRGLCWKLFKEYHGFDEEEKPEKTQQQTFFDSLPTPYWHDQWDPDEDTKGIQQKESQRIWRQKRNRYEATYKKTIQERLADMEERRPKWEAIHRKLKQDLGL